MRQSALSEPPKHTSPGDDRLERLPANDDFAEAPEKLDSLAVLRILNDLLASEPPL
jgi:hypothetical protein